MNSYNHKIKTAAELKALIGERSNGSSGPFSPVGSVNPSDWYITTPARRLSPVVMCHGTFDIVHPGHLRHLMYAKEHSNGGVLIASLTCDEHVTKANYRPYVTEQLRALNLAAYEFVDYVLIDREPTPLTNIALLQPDYFAKGFEYNSGTVATQAEAALVESYGGEMMFTPGDVVYSSSKLIEASPPNIALETLLTGMEANGVTFDSLRAALAGFGGLSVHVVGDTIVDTICETTPTGGMGKTPTLSVHVQQRRNFVGGAAVVAKHLASAGAKTNFSTVIGDDKLGEFVVNDLEAAGVTVHYEVDRTRPTTNKEVIVAGGYRLLKLDTLDNRSISGKILDRLRDEIAASAADIVVFSDFRHGIFNRDTILRLTAAIPQSAFKVADSQVASRWGNILDFKGFDLITPNEKEARFTLGDQDSVIRPLASQLYEASRCGTLLLKMGERGVLVQSAKVGADHYLHAIPAFASQVVDPVGCGDALLAYASLGLKATGSAFIASVLGSVAAALECERDGNIPVSAADVSARLDEMERAAYGHLERE